MDQLLKMNSQITLTMLNWYSQYLRILIFWDNGIIYGLGEASIGLIRMEIVFRATLAIIAERSISIQTNKVYQLKSIQTIEKVFISELTNC